MTATQRRTLTVLTTLVVVAVGMLVWLARGTGDPSSAVTTSESAEAVIASAEVKSDVNGAAAKAATRAYSYSWQTLSDDRAAARALMTRDMQRRYDRTMAGVSTSSQSNHTVVTAEVVDAATVTASTTYARVLLFVNQSTDGDNLDEPTLDLDRVLVTLRLVDGDWKLDELDAL